MHHRMFQKAFFLLIVSTSFLATSAQVRTTGQISGTVTDSSGAVVSGATLTATMPSTGFTSSAKANSAGQYLFPDLQPGVYQVTATAQGFASTTFSDVAVEAARTRDLNFQIKVGQINEKVEVSAQGAQLETTTNTLATTIDPNQIQDLPLAGRDILPLAELVPGAQSGGDERFTTYDALPNAAINITVDGINANSQRYRTSTTGFFTFAPLRLGAFDELTVSTNDLTADAGAEGATTVRFVTKRGSNNFHGNAFWQAVNSYFDANGYTNDALGIPKPLSVVNDWGGSLGGPILRDKLFFFVNFEGEITNPPATIANEVPTPQSLQGNFTYTGTDGNPHTVNLLTLAGNNGFPATVNPLIGPQLTQINGYMTSGTLSPIPGQPYEDTLSFIAHDKTKLYWPTARLDWQISNKINFHGSWDLQYQNIANTEAYYPGDPVLNNGFKSTYYVLSTGVDWTINPHMINQASFGIEGDTEEFNPGNKDSTFQGQGNLEIEAAYLANQGTTPLFQPLIPNFVLQVPRDNPLWNVYDNFTWTRDKHTLTFGGDLRVSNSHELEINSPPTQYMGAVNQPLATNDPAYSMFNNASNFPDISGANNNQDLLNAEALYATLTGRINSVSGSSWVSTSTHQYQVLGNAINWEKQTEGGMYFQDSWRMTPHFALNYGFRWQFSGALHNTDDLWTSPTLADLYGPSTALFQPGVLNGDLNPQVNLRPNPYNGDFKEPSPNLGFAWNPNFDEGFLGKLAGGSNMVIRGGFALSHYDEGWVPIENGTLFTNPGGTQSEFMQPNVQFPAGSLFLGQVSTSSLTTFPTSFTFPQPMSEFFPDASFATVNPNIRTPYVENWNFGIQRKLPGSNVLEISYVGNHTAHMWMAYDINETNIFENGFLTQFQNAQANLATNKGASFSDAGAGLTPTPIFDAAFGGAGAAPGATPVTPANGYANSSYIALVEEGQAGALANALAISPTFLCNMIGNSFSPCTAQGVTGPGHYPMNFFQVNPFAMGGYATELSDPGSESYNALQVQLKHQGHGLQMNANYTYSHAFTNRYLGDYYTADSALVNFVTLRDPGLSRGPSPYDLRHVFRTYFTYDLPFGSGKTYRTNKAAIDHVIGGWTVGSVITIQSGRNFKLQGGSNTFNYSNAYWPDASDSGVQLNGITAKQLQHDVGIYQGPNTSELKTFLPANVAALVGPETTPGQLGQMIYLSGPKYWNTDISLVKSIPIHEQIKFNIYAEFLNAFNHTDWGVIDSFSAGTNNPAEYANASNAQFAKLSLPAYNSPGYNPRNIQFRLQLTF
jgi:hypothetical protein